MAKSMAILSGSEENSALSAAIAQLSSVQEKISSIHHDQASVEFFELSELIKDYLGLVGAVKGVFHVSVRAERDFSPRGICSTIYRINVEAFITSWL